VLLLKQENPARTLFDAVVCVPIKLQRIYVDGGKLLVNVLFPTLILSTAEPSRTIPLCILVPPVSVADAPAFRSIKDVPLF